MKRVNKHYYGSCHLKGQGAQMMKISEMVEKGYILTMNIKTGENLPGKMFF